MRLFKPQEREVAFKKEKDLSQIQAALLSKEVSELIKSFNEAKNQIENNKKILSEDYKKWRIDLEEEKQILEESIAKLIQERNTALEPLYQKEKDLKQTADSLKQREGILVDKESNLRVREKDINELKEITDAVYEKISKTEQNILKEKEALRLREIKFEKHMKGQKEFFKQNEQRLRDWLEKERAKLRK